jgi:hypothetical protein
VLVVKDVAMIYAGVFFFFLAIASGVCGFSGMLSAGGADVAQTVFFSSQLLASLTFAWPLVHTCAAPSESSPDSIADPRMSRPNALAANALLTSPLDPIEVSLGLGRSNEPVLFKEPLHPLALAAPSLQ